MDVQIKLQMKMQRFKRLHAWETRGEKGSIMTTKVLFAQPVVPVFVRLPTMMMVIEGIIYT